MPELYGAFDGEADSQYAACVGCGELTDLFEAHPMFREDAVNEFGDVTATTYHFCSDGCLDSWLRQRNTGE
ncbi:DUF7576 family protein [Halorussus marinus]|uniref:DUF7576 family protein n=1 Tax=Halorussus marinus TaxID=2505976 RepID=UPI00106EC68D|nr:hypothetical protein [Halorussus marinus]